MKRRARAFYAEKYGSRETLREAQLRFERRVRLAFSLLEKERPGVFLDVGCGDGAFARALLDSGAVSRAFGTDIDARMVKLAKRRGVRANVANTDEKRLPFPDSRFDAVFCGEVIEHVYDTDFLASELHRVLKPGGLLVLTTPNLSSWLSRVLLLLGYQPHLSEVSLRRNYGKPGGGDEVSGHIHLFTHRALLAFLRDHGFSVKRVLGVRGIEGGAAGAIDAVLTRVPALAGGVLVAARKEGASHAH